MRISGLAAATGVPVATLKYYLREGLVPPGAATSRTQADYDDTHVGRVRLVRALTESAGLSLAAVRDVLAALDDPPTSRHDLLGAAHHALVAAEGDRAAGAGTDLSRRRARELVAERGWCDDLLLVDRLAEQLDAADAAGVEVSDDYLRELAAAADQIGTADLGTVRPDPVSALRQVVLGTLLTDPVLLTLRRMAQVRASRETGGV
ncbi:MerR-like DNA binding protein [Isoptericola sp. CG 20/1183]|uniref:MerR-like DNA binding protein n=1 Tax=Isoptericola halotolerans TaxID=300560 RepID=A0ABX5EA09_9MICO|nr:MULTISPECIES: MerR family transcriptional regulator [Isoptericola]PRZ02771.1 MerR-like DNA binding protein [Isoptericola sp. CG 20/1183]PRZ03149.1 MerR-like DNA binding protein [Isoptericola halotolerans]